MTHRDQLIETVRGALDRAYADHDGWYSGARYAEAVVDAVLPRVTTEEQRLAVRPGTVVMSDAGTLAGRFDEHRAVVLGDERPVPWTDLALPLTIVWQPS